MIIGDLIYYLKWWDTAVFLTGLAVAVWAFRRCRKRAWLVVGAYFALALFAWHVWPPIRNAIYACPIPPPTEQVDNAAKQKTLSQAFAEAKNLPPPVAIYRISVQVGPVVLVWGLWLLARREPEHHRPDKLPPPTSGGTPDS